ncbi:hypothetical protein N7G274_000581 [Stereocaulon virgatum]|uniref:Uncharacterized protein n=1 Tax=Stereocaulon virgatum TaxID=373712 RepID=A0ABR4ASZ2_9LECA
MPMIVKASIELLIDPSVTVRIPYVNLLIVVAISFDILPVIKPWAAMFSRLEIVGHVRRTMCPPGLQYLLSLERKPSIIDQGLYVGMTWQMPLLLPTAPFRTVRSTTALVSDKDIGTSSFADILESIPPSRRTLVSRPDEFFPLMATP